MDHLDHKQLISCWVHKWHRKFANHLSTVAKWIRDATCYCNSHVRRQAGAAICLVEMKQEMYKNYVCSNGCCRMYMVSYRIILKMWQSNRIWYFWYINGWICRIYWQYEIKSGGFKNLQEYTNSVIQKGRQLIWCLVCNPRDIVSDRAH